MDGFGGYKNAAIRGAVRMLVNAFSSDTGITKSEVSRICADLDEEVSAQGSGTSSLAEQAFPYVFSDATYCKGPAHSSEGFPHGVVSRRS